MRMKFGQFIEYNMRNIFLEKSYHKCGGETSPRLFYKKSYLSDLLIESLKYYKFVFIVCVSRGLPKYIKTKVLTTCFYFI